MGKRTLMVVKAQAKRTRNFFTVQLPFLAVNLRMNLIPASLIMLCCAVLLCQSMRFRGTQTMQHVPLEIDGNRQRSIEDDYDASRMRQLLTNLKLQRMLRKRAGVAYNSDYLLLLDKMKNIVDKQQSDAWNSKLKDLGK
ncbi:Hypothetical predicted protein [Octopus vulgaris]|uniref:Uncharacterized protein n=1 Tax=Octopus vulgaris TaxID=6645 RepID=A0AA36AUB0_OCTVU|nr:Hypothetical predicted protein [Octopus vulgaris]